MDPSFCLPLYTAPLCCCNILSGFALFSLWLYTLCFCAPVCLCLFSFWLLFPLLSYSINVSFNSPVILRSRSSPVPSHSTCLSHFEMKSLDAARDKTGMQPNAKYHCQGPLLNLIWMLHISWYIHIRPHSYYGGKKESWDILLLQQIIKYRRPRITPAALTHKQNTPAE